MIKNITKMVIGTISTISTLGTYSVIKHSVMDHHNTVEKIIRENFHE